MPSRSHPQQAPGDGASRATRREFVIGGALLSTAVVAAVAGRGLSNPVLTTSRAALDDLVPKSIGPWTDAPYADVQIPRAEKAQERSYDEVLTRYYNSQSEAPVTLLIAHGRAQVGGTELHRPEACYPVAGFKLHRRPDLTLHLPRIDVAARSMTASASDRTEQLLYWTRVGQEFPTSSLSQRWSAVRQTFDGSIPDGVLVRMSALGLEWDAAVGVLQRFANELLINGGPALRLLLTGRA